MIRSVKRTIAKFNTQSLTPKVYHQGQILTVDIDSVQLSKNKKTIKYNFCRDTDTHMYHFFKDMQDSTKYAGNYDLDYFALFIRDDIVYVIHSKYYGVKSKKVRKTWFGFVVDE